MRRLKKLLFLAVFLAGLILGPSAEAAESKAKNVILSTTTSTQDSGLLDVLVPLFEKQTGYSVKTVSVGTARH
jgi:tungstate transport system substrate-binding protein